MCPVTTARWCIVRRDARLDTAPNNDLADTSRFVSLQGNAAGVSAYSVVAWVQNGDWGVGYDEDLRYEPGVVKNIAKWVTVNVSIYKQEGRTMSDLETDPIMPTTHHVKTFFRACLRSSRTDVWPNINS